MDDGGLRRSGDVIGDRFEVMRAFPGGMGVVYLCLDLDRLRPVAVKTLLPAVLADGTSREAFLQEASLWLAIPGHRHIVTAEQVVLAGPDAQPHLVIEFVAAPDTLPDASLRTRLRSRPMNVHEALRVGIEVVRGMRHATDAVHGLVHRDLKPANVLIGLDDTAQVTDFGLAVAIRRIGAAPLFSDAAGANDAGGTPRYMAPEQWRSSPVDRRADLYAFGAVLYELLTGVPAVGPTGTDLADLRRAHEQGRGRYAPMPAKWPPALRSLLTGCLAPDPADRPASWAVAEESLAAVHGQLGLPLPLPPEPAPLPPPVTDAHLDDDQVRRSTRHSLHALAVAARAVGRGDAAAGYEREALDRARADGDRRLEAAAWNGIAVDVQGTGRHDLALEFADRALTAALADNDHWTAAGVRVNRGNALAALGRTDDAEADIRTALDVFQQVGDHSSAAVAALALASLLRSGPEAAQLARQAHRWAADGNDRARQAAALGMIADLHRRAGDPGAALGPAEQSLALALAVADRRQAAARMLDLGHVHLEISRDRLGRALSCWYQGLSLARQTSDRMLLGQLAFALARSLSPMAHARRNPAEYRVLLVLARHACRSYGDQGRSDLAIEAMDLAFHLESQLGLVERMGPHARPGPLHPAFEPAAAFAEELDAELTGAPPAPGPDRPGERE